MTTEARQEAKDAVKRRLKQYRPLEGERIQIEGELAQLEARRTAPGTSRWGLEPKGSGGSDPMTDGLAAKEKLQSLYQSLLSRIEEEQLAIETAINALDTKHRSLLRHKYIDGLTWEEVCVKMTYSWSQTHRFHAEALDMLVERGDLDAVPGGASLGMPEA